MTHYEYEHCASFLSNMFHFNSENGNAHAVHIIRKNMERLRQQMRNDIALSITDIDRIETILNA